MFQCVLKRTFTTRFVLLQHGLSCRRTKNDGKMLTKMNHQNIPFSKRWHQVILCSFSSSHTPCTLNRTFSTEGSTETDNFSLEKRLIERWIYEVDTFGKLDVSMPFDLEISTLNPQEYPEMNKALVTILTKEDGQNDKARSFSDIYNLKIEENKDEKTLTVSSGLADGIVLPLICSIKIPLKFDLKIRNSQPSNVSIKKTECDKIDVYVTGGDCKLKTVKSGQVSVVCKNGNITSQSMLQGNIRLKTEGKGNIKVKRMQGSTIGCEAEAGTISVESIYADKSKISCCHGNVHLGNCHGNTDVRIDTGNLTVDTLDGDLTAEIDKGNADVFIERHEKVKLTCGSGNIALRCRDNLQSDVEIVADSLHVDDNIDFDHSPAQHGGQTKFTGFIKSQRGGRIVAHTKEGNVKISSQSWLSSIGLKFGS